jgi:hypothetical protein
LTQDTFFVGHLKGVGKVYVHAVVDTYCSFTFGFLHVSTQPEAAVAVLHKRGVAILLGEGAEGGEPLDKARSSAEARITPTGSTSS